MATPDDGAALQSPEKPYKVPIVAPGHTTATVTDKISAVVQSRTPRWWFIGFGISFLLLMMFLNSVTWLLWNGVGHAGTLISAILLLLRQEWRTSINRFAEAMTLFAVSCAGLYQLLHLG